MQSRALFPGIVFILVGAAMLLSRLGLSFGMDVPERPGASA